MIRPCLTFVDRAEEAVKLYVSVFPNSKIVSMQRVESDGGPIPKGKLLNATFELDGREYLAFDGGPTFTFSEGISLMVTCKTQQEVDKYWTKLTENGGEDRRDAAGAPPARTRDVLRHIVDTIYLAVVICRCARRVPDPGRPDPAAYRGCAARR